MNNCSTRKRKFLKLVSIILTNVLLLSTAVHAATAYVSDEIGAPMRSGASNAHRIVNLAVPSGTELEILSEDKAAGFTQVRTRRGTEGWIRTEHISLQPNAKELLRRANSNLGSANQQILDLRAQLDQVNSEYSSTQSENSGLKASLVNLQTELDNIRRISTGALDLAEENRKMATLNERLRAEVDSLITEKNLLQDNLQQKWLLIGAGLVLSGLLLGLFIKSRPRRSGWS